MSVLMRRRFRRPSSADRGSAIVEFALVALELFIVLFACLEFGRMLLVYTSVANAARVGLRYAITHGADRAGGTSTGSALYDTGVASQANVCSVVADYTKGSLLNSGSLIAGCGQTTGTRIQVLWPFGNAAASPVQVTVVYYYDPFFTAFPFLRVPLGSTAEGIITY